MTRLLAVVVLAAACGSRAPAPVDPQHPAAGSGAVVRPDAGPGTAPDETPSDGRPTTAECEGAVDHLIDLDVADRPADQAPVADELAKARADMRTQFVPRCMRELTRDQIRCIAASATTAAVEQCR